MATFKAGDEIRIIGFEIPTKVLEVKPCDADPCADERCDGELVRYANAVNGVEHWDHAFHFEKV